MVAKKIAQQGVVAGEHCASPELLGPAIQGTGGQGESTGGFLRLPRVEWG